MVIVGFQGFYCKSQTMMPHQIQSALEKEIDGKEMCKLQFQAFKIFPVWRHKSMWLLQGVTLRVP